MTNEFDFDAVSQVEGILNSDADKPIQVRFSAFALLALDQHLTSMREMRRREIGVSHVGERDEDVLSSLQSMFRRTLEGEPAPVVTIDISFREMDALGNSLPRVFEIIDMVKKAAGFFSEYEQTFYGELLKRYRVLHRAFVYAGGRENKELLERLARLGERKSK